MEKNKALWVTMVIHHKSCFFHMLYFHYFLVYFYYHIALYVYYSKHYFIVFQM